MFTFLNILAAIALVVGAVLWYAMYNEGLANWREQKIAGEADSESAE